MSTAEERRQRAAYMREWNRRNSEHVRQQRNLRRATNPVVNKKRRRGARIQALQERGGFDAASGLYLDIILSDPCAYCGCAVLRTHNRKDAAHIEHIDPAGSSHWTNLTIACCSCNASKGKVPLLLSLLERSLRRDLTPIAEQLWLIKGRSGQRRRIEF